MLLDAHKKVELKLIISLFAGEDGMVEGANMHALEITGLEIAEIRLRKLMLGAI